MVRISLVQEYFHPWPNSAGFHVARERGLYSRAGIDLELRTVDPYRGDGLAYLVSGEADAAVFPSNRLLVRREQGEALVAVAAVNQRGLETLRTRADSGIRRLRDLEGRRVALNPTPRGRGIVRALVASDGGDPDAVLLVDAGSRELDPADHFGGLADATFGSYWAWDTLLTTLPAADERVWRVDDALDLRYHSYLLGTTEASADAAPALWEDLVAITAEGFALAAENPDEAADVFDRVTPYFPRRIVERSLELIAPTWFHDEQWGVVRRELVEPYAAWLGGLGILERPGEWASAFRTPVADDTELAS